MLLRRQVQEEEIENRERVRQAETAMNAGQRGMGGTSRSSVWDSVDTGPAAAARRKAREHADSLTPRRMMSKEQLDALERQAMDDQGYWFVPAVQQQRRALEAGDSGMGDPFGDAFE